MEVRIWMTVSDEDYDFDDNFGFNGYGGFGGPGDESPDNVFLEMFRAMMRDGRLTSKIQRKKKYKGQSSSVSICFIKSIV